VRDAEWPERLRALGADVAVVVAFGQILPRAVLDAPRRGSINVHASLLPRYRGAAPIQWAIMRGEAVTASRRSRWTRHGHRPMLLSESLAIGPDETAGELSARLAVLGASVIVETLARLDALTPEPQPREGATLAPRLKRADGYLDWRRPARELVNVVRGCNPWPGALTRSPWARSRSGARGPQAQVPRIRRAR